MIHNGSYNRTSNEEDYRWVYSLNNISNYEYEHNVYPIVYPISFEIDISNNLVGPDTYIHELFYVNLECTDDFNSTIWSLTPGNQPDILSIL